MVSPFAIYFHGVLGLDLDWIQGSSVSTWTIQFFRPNLLETSKSNVIEVLETSDIILIFAGILDFALGAFEIYQGRLRKNEAPIQDNYRNIRHPQYLAPIIASIGMLFVWPQFLGLFETRKVIFVYIILVKTKEKICLAKLLDYADYVKITCMVLPKGWVPLLSLNTSGTPARFGVCVAIYAAAMTIATFAAQGLRTYAITNHKTYEAENAVYLSTVTIRDEYLTKVEKIALNAPQAQPVRDALRGALLLNYVMLSGCMYQIFQCIYPRMKHLVTRFLMIGTARNIRSALPPLRLTARVCQKAVQS